MTGRVCAIFGADVKPLLARSCAYHGPVAANYRKILATNVANLMRLTPELKSHAKLAAKCRTLSGRRKIGPRTIGHLLDAENGPQPQLDTILAVAEAFKVPPYMLLRPDFDAETRTTNTARFTGEVLEIAQSIADMSEEKRALLLEIFATEATPAGPARTPSKPPATHELHEPRRQYEAIKKK